MANRSGSRETCFVVEGVIGGMENVVELYSFLGRIGVRVLFGTSWMHSITVETEGTLKGFPGSRWSCVSALSEMGESGGWSMLMFTVLFCGCN